MCDHKSVGVVLSNPRGEILLIERAHFPIGFAPPAGHVDDHGSLEQTGLAEVQEETGLTIPAGKLKRSAINGRRINNRCSREKGDHHIWTVFETHEFAGVVRPDANETKGADWYSQAKLQALADRTKTFLAGNISPSEWEATPALEPIWLDFLMELGYVT